MYGLTECITNKQTNKQTSVFIYLQYIGTHTHTKYNALITYLNVI